MPFAGMLGFRPKSFRPLSTTYFVNTMNNSIAHHSTRLFACLVLAGALAPATLWGQDENVLFRAMQDELARSVQRLKLENQGTPYFVEYRVNENRGYRINGSFGALIASQPYHNRSLAVSIHIGDYDFDNTGFFARADLFNSFGSSSGNTIVIEDNYMALRRDLWLATDKAYKDGVEQMASKRGYLESRVEKDTVPDFSREPLTKLIDVKEASGFDTATWEAHVRRWSAIFRNYPQIQESSVDFQLMTPNFYLTNSEGSRIHTGTEQGTIAVSMSTQASDGIALRRSYTIQLASPNAAPTDAEMEELIRKIVLELTALQEAPSLDKTYIGPVLFVDEAACTFFQQTLGPHLSGSRPPLVDDQSIAGLLGGESELAKRMNLRVMPRFLSAYDDPTVNAAHGTLLAGHYRTDDQGIEARRVSLIENGVVKGLLTSRRPGTELRHSNGHGRGFASPGAAMANLFVETTEGKSYEELKEELISYCRDLDLEYGIVISRMGESAASFMGGGISIRMGSDDNAETATAVRVYVADGREEPLRGIKIDDLNLRTLKDIVAAGKDYTVLNTSTRASGVIDFSRVFASIIAPPVLLEEVQINPSTTPKQKPVLLTHPYFEKGE